MERHQGRLTMVIALIGLALAWAVMFLLGAMEFDRGLLLVLHAGGRPDLARVAVWITELGGAAILIPVTGAGAGFLLARRQFRSALLLIGISLSGRGLVILQKDWTARIRPDAQGHLVSIDSLSFPSGHAANATLVWILLALLLPRNPRTRSMALWAAVWTALAVGTSRVVLGVHWPSDVIGGWAFGLFWTLLMLHLAGGFLNEGTVPGLIHSLPEGARDERRTQNGVGEDP